MTVVAYDSFRGNERARTEAFHPYRGGAFTLTIATMTFLSAVVLLFLVMDPLGNVPLFLSALKHVPVERHRQVILREMFFALAILVVFLLGGGHMLRLLGLSQPALTVAGGVIRSEEHTSELQSLMRLSY